jgi:hypothetical protein
MRLPASYAVLSAWLRDGKPGPASETGPVLDAANAVRRWLGWPGKPGWETRLRHSLIDDEREQLLDLMEQFAEPD